MAGALLRCSAGGESNAARRPGDTPEPRACVPHVIPSARSAAPSASPEPRRPAGAMLHLVRSKGGRPGMSDALHKRERALEEEFFARKDQQLRDKLKATFEQEVTREKLKAATGITDLVV